MKFLNSLGAGLAALVSVAVADDTAILYKEAARNANQSLLWGPYRPNLYFGVRPRIPKSLMGGLMWSKVENFQDVQNSKYLSYFWNWAIGKYFEHE
jgi:mannosyl-oligosaccharide glucosidase